MGAGACPANSRNHHYEGVQISPQKNSCRLSWEWSYALLLIGSVGCPVYLTSQGKGLLFSDRLQPSPHFSVEGEEFLSSELSSRQQLQYSVPWEQPRGSAQQYDSLLCYPSSFDTHLLVLHRGNTHSSLLKT